MATPQQTTDSARLIVDAMSAALPYSNITHIGISYMLRGETGADFNDMHAEKPPQGKDWYHAVPT